MKTQVITKQELELIPRWQGCIARNAYLEWLSYSTYMLGLSRIAVADTQFAHANDLLLLSQVAYQRALDMQPAEVAA